MKKQTSLATMGLLVLSFSLGCPVGLGGKKIADVQDIKSTFSELKTNIIKDFKGETQAQTKSDVIQNGLVNVSQTISSAAMQAVIQAPQAPSVTKPSDGYYPSPPASSPPPKIRLFSYIEKNTFTDIIKVLFPYKKKGLQIAGEYSYPIYLVGGEKGSGKITTDANDILKNITVTNSTGKEISKIDYSILENPTSPKGAKAQDIIKGSNVKLWGIDTVTNKELNVQGNIIIAGQFDQENHFFKTPSALQCNFNGTFDNKTANAELTAYNFAPFSASEANNQGVMVGVPEYINLKATLPDQIISKASFLLNYDWSNTKNIDYTLEATFNKQEWKFTTKALYDPSLKTITYQTPTGPRTYPNSFPYGSVNLRLENITKNFVITLDGTAPKTSSPGTDWTLKGEIISGAQKLADIELKDGTCGTAPYTSKCKKPFILYTDGTQEDLEKYFKEISDAILPQPKQVSKTPYPMPSSASEK